MYQDSEGKLWWKGNLHMHTTCSDGKKTPQEAMEIYQKAGYDFIALTDHWKPSSDGQYANMLTLPGVELDTMQGGCWHIVGIGMEREIQADRHMRGQELHRCHTGGRRRTDSGASGLVAGSAGRHGRIDRSHRDGDLQFRFWISLFRTGRFFACSGSGFQVRNAGPIYGIR